MDKVLPALCVAAAVLVALFAVVFTGVVVSLVLMAVVAAIGVFAILQRDRFGLATGITLVVLALLGALFAVGNVSWKGGGVGNTAETTGAATALAIALVAAVAVVPARWGRGRPSWVSFAAVAAALVSILLLFGFQEELGNPGAAGNYGVAVLALACAVPALLVMVDRPAATRPAGGAPVGRKT